MEESVAAAPLRERLAEAGLQLVCPLCKGPLDDRENAFACGACAREYPVVAGIPDFRLLPDRFISFGNDRRKGLHVLELAQARGGGFEAALDAYWSITPELAPALAARHRAHQVMEVDIGKQTLHEVERCAGRLQDLGAGAPPVAANADFQEPAQRAGDSARPKTMLDIGCGTAGLLAAAGSRFGLAVGVDVAFRWLLVGRLRLREAGLDAPLICANAEYLPFPAASFQQITANDLLEHVVAPEQVFTECRRVVAPSGCCYFSTNNRYSLAPEPHVHIWGVGFLARGLQSSYVRSVRDHSYQNVSLLSAGELRRLASRAGLQSQRVEPAALYARHLGGTIAGIVGAYNSMRLLPPLRDLLAVLGPRLQIMCRPKSKSEPPA